MSQDLYGIILIWLDSGSPPQNGSPSESSKRSKRSFQSKTYNVEISFAAKIPLKSISLALQGSEAQNTQDALRVLDIILRQQAANRYFRFCPLARF